MKQNETVKLIGIIVLVVMAFSMVAGIAISVMNNPIQTNSSSNDNTLEPTATVFSYTLSFDANAIKDLSSFRTALVTSFEDKTLIDAQVKKIGGVSTVSSQFRKDSADANTWIYLAEITVKKGTSINDVLTGIYSISYFDSNSDKIAMKHMTISVPSSVMLHNTDLNIDRNYSFPSTTLSALTGMSTLSGDELTVEGTIKLQGTVLNSVELLESVNKTAQARMIQEWQNQINDQNKIVTADGNTVIKIDTNQ